MTFNLLCKYCGTKWSLSFNQKSANTNKCGICGDTDLEITTADKSKKIDYYAGSPAFPDKELAVKEPKPKYNEPLYLDSSQLFNFSTLKDS